MLLLYAKIKVDQAKAEEIKDFYHAEEIKDVKRPYEYFCTRINGVEIHAYKNRKDIYTIIFFGDKKALEEAEFFSDKITITQVEKTPKKERNYFENWDDLSAQIGSDEVGVGDFFGPLIVVASYIDENDIGFLENLKINDSKKMTDDYILEIGSKIKRRIKNYIVMLSPEKLSTLVENHFNIHKIMAKCHNFAQEGLKKKYDLSDELIVYIDQFESEDNYKRLVGDELISNPLYFKTKGETYYPSIAVSSVIARYTFLQEWKKLEDKFGVKIPKGASATVDTVYHILKKRFPDEYLRNYVKRYFRNYRE